MPIHDVETLRALLAASGASLSPGLAGDEIDGIERRFGFEFGQDHRELLAVALPLGKGWVDWRDGSEGELRSRVDWPVDSILFHVNRDSFWPSSWGARPADPARALDVARENLRQAPVLLPVYGHRFLPAAPSPPRSPVFSVYGTDTIYYGADLEDYLDREFGAGPPQPLDRLASHVPFWSELAESRPVP